MRNALEKHGFIIIELNKSIEGINLDTFYQDQFYDVVSNELFNSNRKSSIDSDNSINSIDGMNRHE